MIKMHIHLATVLATAVLLGCGGSGGSSKSTAKSADATYNADAIYIGDLDTYSDYQKVSKAQLKKVSKDKFAYVIRTFVADRHNRQCRAYLKMTSNFLTRIDQTSSAWQAGEEAEFDFVFRYTDFEIYDPSSFEDPELFLKLDCRVLGELTNLLP